MKGSHWVLSSPPALLLALSETQDCRSGPGVQLAPAPYSLVEALVVQYLSL